MSASAVCTRASLGRAGPSLAVSTRRAQVQAPARRVIITRAEPNDDFIFSENRQQVKRLLNRDRQDLLNFEEIQKSLESEFEEKTTAPPDAEDAKPSTSKPAASAAAPAAKPAATPASPFGAASGAAKPAAGASPFGAAKPGASPFGAGSAPAGPANPFGSNASASMRPAQNAMSPDGLSPDMEVNPLKEEEKFSVQMILDAMKGETLFLLFSFSLLTVIMMATIWVVWHVGGISLNE